MRVELLTSPASVGEMERNTALAALTCHANAEKEHVASEVLGRIIKAGHESVLEHITLTYRVKGLSRACLQELARHRHISLSVESTRHTLHKYLAMSDDEITAFFEEYLDTLPLTIDKELKQVCCGAYLGVLRGMKMMDFPNDEVKYFVPEFWPTNLVLTSNVRELRHILRLRTAPAALKEFKDLARAMYEAVPEEYMYLLEDCLYENRSGKWQLYEDKDTNAWKCSKCGGVWQLYEGTPSEHRMKYCSYCGTEMRGEQASDE